MRLFLCPSRIQKKFKSSWISDLKYACSYSYSYSYSNNEMKMKKKFNSFHALSILWLWTVWLPAFSATQHILCFNGTTRIDFGLSKVRALVMAFFSLLSFFSLILLLFSQKGLSYGYKLLHGFLTQKKVRFAVKNIWGTPRPSLGCVFLFF